MSCRTMFSIERVCANAIVHCVWCVWIRCTVYTAERRRIRWTQKNCIKMNRCHLFSFPIETDFSLAEACVVVHIVNCISSQFIWLIDDQCHYLYTVHSAQCRLQKTQHFFSLSNLICCQGNRLTQQRPENNIRNQRECKYGGDLVDFCLVWLQKLKRWKYLFSSVNLIPGHITSTHSVSSSTHTYCVEWMDAAIDSILYRIHTNTIMNFIIGVFAEEKKHNNMKTQETFHCTQWSSVPCHANNNSTMQH